MVKEECKTQFKDMLGLYELFSEHQQDYFGQYSREIGELAKARKDFIRDIRREGSITDDEEIQYMKKLDYLTEQMRAGNIDKAVTETVNTRESILNDALSKLTECECGEMDHVSLKIPVDLSIHETGTIEDALKKAGYDVGTDGYYADPDNYYTVIVSATKKQELRRGGG